MVSIAVSWIAYHLLIPAVLISSVIFRYNVLSSVYLILLLAYPYMPGLTHATKGRCCSYVFSLLIASTLFILAQMGFQIALLVMTPYGSAIDPTCSEKEKLLRYIGFERLDKMPIADVFRFLLPDVISFIVATLTFVLIRKTTEATEQQQQVATRESETLDDNQPLSDESSGSDIGILRVTSTALKNATLLFFTMMVMAIAGIASPSLFSGFYLVIFMALMTAWSLHGKLLNNAVAVLRVLVSFVAAVQLILLFFYQMDFFRDALPQHDLPARLMGLIPFVNTTCTEENTLVLNPGLPWWQFVSPPFIFFMYWLLAIGVRLFYTSDQNRLQSRGSDSARRRRRRQDERMVRSSKALVVDVESDEMKLQPLVQEEEVPQNYDAINASTSAPGPSHRQDSQGPDPQHKKGYLHVISDWISGLKNQSFYVVVLIVMMAWSVTFHSWLTLVLLVWSCILWLVKDRSWGTLLCSPAITVYAMLLICLQFIYSINLTEGELPTTAQDWENRTMNLSSFGIYHFYKEDPGLLLGAQILYTCVFWIVLHQFVYIRRHRQQTQKDPTDDENDKSWMLVAGAYLKEKLSKYWILLVYAFLLAIAVTGRPSGIKMVYAIFATSNAFLFEISWTLWRRMLSLFLFSLVVYTMVVVLLVYTFQFDEFPGYWRSFTNFTDVELADLGLIKYDEAGQLLLHICIPTLFLLVVILQKHYFHDRFLQLVKTRVKELRTHSGSDAPDTAHEPREPVATVAEGSSKVEEIEMQEIPPGEEADATKKELAIQCAKKSAEIFLLYWYGLVRLVWRLLEFHVWKLVIIAVLVSSLQRATALYGVLFITWVLFIPVKTFRPLLYVVTCGYVGLLLLASMFYQLEFITELRGEDLMYNCSFQLNATVWKHEYDLVVWFGFSKMPDGSEYFYHAQGYITILIILALERVVMRRQDWRRHFRREAKLDTQLTALYPSITWKQADDTFISCAKYVLNHWFYKFGVEACFIMAVITIWARADFYAVVYAIFFVISMLIKTRSRLTRYWSFYTFILIAILIAEYAVALGMPPIWCIHNEYPWTTLAHTTEIIRDRLIRWLYLPDYMVPPNITNLIVDVFQLLFIVCQLFVFQFETSEVSLAHGGENKYLTKQHLDAVTPATNPTPNFMMKKSDGTEDKWSRNVLDQFKVAIFKYSFWVTVAIVFIAGTSRISLFCMGYLIASFYLLSFNQSLLMGKPSRLLRIWNFVLGYNVSVIILKVSLQIASCVYIDTLSLKACGFVQLLSLVCARPADYRGLSESVDDETCATPDAYTNAGLTWDFVCFLFLIIQRRIFQSYYFLHISEDLRISMKLASRGAELFEEKLIQEVGSRKEAEESGISQIRENMLSIQKKYSNLAKGGFTPETHVQAMRSGDYYMFEDDDEREGEEKKDKDILNPLQMLHVADTSGIDKALESREEDKRLLEEGEDHLPVPKETLAGRSTEDLTRVGEGEGEADGPAKRNIIVKGVIFLWELLMSGIDTVILWLNTINCDYRNVALRLAGEKDDLTTQNVLQSRNEETTAIIIEAPEEAAGAEEGASVHSDPQLKQQVSEDNAQVSTSGDVAQFEDRLKSQTPDLEPIDFDKDQMRLFRLFYAIWYTIISRTDMVCYFLVILNLMLTASILSLVLPIAIFLWSTLSTPRPTNRFWNFCIIYLEIVITIRFLFQFEFFPWNYDAISNIHENDPFWWPRILGIEQKERWSALDLAQLLSFFFHRSILKIHGLWKKKDKKGNTEEAKGAEKGETGTEEDPAAKGDAAPSQQSQEGEEEEQTEKQAEEEEGKKGQKTARLKRAATSPLRFYQRVINQEFSAVTDVYIYIFLCDVINFIIIIFGYWAFGKYATQATDVVSNISSNRVPTGFLVMLLIQFAMMFIDRALYLRKNLIGKLIFQFCLVIGVHLWMFFLLPLINERPFYMNGVAQTWYFFKAVYFLLSAYQIRCGYPTRVLGNFLTKSYGTANLFLFKGYLAIPFLAELTAVMNWMFIETTMGIGEWFKFQSIYAEVFELKCWRVFEKNYPAPRATPKSKLIKYLVGGLLVFFLVAIIWFPLLFMNIVLTIGGVTNNPVQVSIQITVGTFEPLFQVVADSDAIRVWDDKEFNKFAEQHSADPVAAQFLSAFSGSQVVSVRVDGESKTVWGISPPQSTKLMEKLDVANPAPVLFDFEWKLIRNSERTTVVTSSGNNKLSLARNDTSRLQLYNLLSNPATEVTPATMRRLFPKYIYAGEKSVSTAAEKLYSTNSSESYSDVNLTLRYAPDDNMTSWWRVIELPQNANLTDPSFELIVLSDKVSPASLSFLVSYGIIGLYVSIVLVVGKLVRGILVGSTSDIMFQDLPRVDRILQLCLDIYLVREEQQFQLEEDLFAKLIFLYRSPQTMIRWTRPKVD